MTERLALIVDDNETNRRLAGLMLQKAGWMPLEADSGERALALASAHAFELVLLDISMPGLSGEDTCAALRTAYAGRDVRIVAYTAHAFPEERARFLAIGFDEILVKPITRQSLEEAIRRP